VPASGVVRGGSACPVCAPNHVHPFSGVAGRAHNGGRLRQHIDLPDPRRRGEARGTTSNCLSSGPAGVPGCELGDLPLVWLRLAPTTGAGRGWTRCSSGARLGRRGRCGRCGSRGRPPRRSSKAGRPRRTPVRRRVHPVSLYRRGAFEGVEQDGAPPSCVVRRSSFARISPQMVVSHRSRSTACRDDTRAGDEPKNGQLLNTVTPNGPLGAASRASHGRAT